MQIAIKLLKDDRNMNSKYIAVVAALAVMLVAATASVTTDSAFADRKKGGYGNSQAAGSDIDCGNGDNPIDVFCQILPSQTQGDGNAGISFGNQD